MQHYILQVLENIVFLQDSREALATNAAYTIPVTTVFRKLLRQRVIYLFRNFTSAVSQDTQLLYVSSGFFQNCPIVSPFCCTMLNGYSEVYSDIGIKF